MPLHECRALRDIKSDTEATHAVRRPVLAAYRGMLTSFRDDRVDTGAVSAILYGDRPRETLATEPIRLAAIDGRLAELGTRVSARVVPRLRTLVGLQRFLTLPADDPPRR